MSILLQDLRDGIPRAFLAVAAVWSTALYAQAVDTKAAASAIMQADRELNRSVATRDTKKFLSLISEAAVFVGDGPMRGHAEILKGWGPFFEPNGPTLSWEPTSAEVLVGGDVGVTIGSWIRRTKAADGNTSEARGQYVTTWQKQKDGTWKVVYDIGSTAP
jgi:ketosteroid isomerase-like protein